MNDNEDVMKQAMATNVKWKWRMKKWRNENNNR